MCTCTFLNICVNFCLPGPDPAQTTTTTVPDISMTSEPGLISSSSSSSSSSTVHSELNSHYKFIKTITITWSQWIVNVWIFWVYFSLPASYHLIMLKIKHFISYQDGSNLKTFFLTFLRIKLPCWNNKLMLLPSDYL